MHTRVDFIIPDAVEGVARIGIPCAGDRGRSNARRCAANGGRSPRCTKRGSEPPMYRFSSVLAIIVQYPRAVSASSQGDGAQSASVVSRTMLTAGLPGPRATTGGRGDGGFRPLSRGCAAASRVAERRRQRAYVAAGSCRWAAGGNSGWKPLPRRAETNDGWRSAGAQG